jgi:hypothetical protein
MNKNIHFMYWLIILGFCFCLIGYSLQFRVITNNECKMPVINTETTQRLLQDNKLFNKLNHEYLLFNSKEDVKYYYLTDIIPVFNQGYMSIGDIFIYFGVLLNFSGLIVFIIIKRNELSSKTKEGKE